MRRLAIIFLLFAAACGDDVKKSNPNGDPGNNSVTDAGNVDPGDAGSVPDSTMDATADAGSDMGPAPSCDDDILNGDETDVDCGGSCSGCDNGGLCVDSDDCASTYCAPNGTCDVAPLPTGAVCAEASECASGRCDDFGGTSYCTEACTDTCPGQNLACFHNSCVPDDYCDDPDGDGLGFGPGCAGQPCDRCDDDATCSEQGDGSFLCMCNAGFTGDGETCADINECTAGTNDCDPNAACTNVPGSFECACDPGFSGDGTTCTDVDECATGADNCDPNAACTNLAGTFECACDPGFTGDGTSCTDVDECAQGTDTCATNASCSNIPGAFDCTCDPGYSGNGFVCDDVDECAAGTDNCDPNAVCTNEPGTFSCACPAGLTGDGLTCTDIDECLANTDNCSPNADCTNTVGGFDCTCDAGYAGDGVTCVDINECTNGTATCGANAQCANFPGTWSCLCRSGYEGDPFAGCTNIDECADGTDVCDPNATCTDTPGNYVCDCEPGFTGNGFTCSDIDECATGADNCDPNAACANTTGGFTCTCDPGYVGDGTTCSYPGDSCDVPNVVNSLPFTANGDTSSATSTDRYAYPDNACPGDSTGNGAGQAEDVYAFTPTVTGDYVARITNSSFSERLYVVTDCADVQNACLAAEFFGDDISLNLTAGTTYYFIVDGGFSGDEGTYTIEISQDYCAAGTCDPRATCTNEFAAAQCSCPSGYTGDGTTCTDIDECATGANDCDANATCTNTDGSFTCACQPGYAGDGTTCWDVNAAGETCANPFPLALGTTYSDDSSLFNNDYFYDDNECPVLSSSTSTFARGEASSDVVYTFTPSATATYEFDVTADHSTALYIVTDCASIGTTCVAAGYDSGGSSTAFTFQTTLDAGVTYFIIVDGTFNFSNSAGNYTMVVNQL